MESHLKSIPDMHVRNAKADFLFGTLQLTLLANIYWLWLSYKLGSVGMLVVGLFPVFWPVTGSVSIYALLFEVPGWVIAAFT